MLLPDVTDAKGLTKHLAVGAGKDVIMYVVDRDNMVSSMRAETRFIKN